VTATGFPAAARLALADAQLRRNMGQATSTIRARRAARKAHPEVEAASSQAALEAAAA